MRLSNKRSPYLFGVATANRTKVTTPNKYGAEIIARMSDWENRTSNGENPSSGYNLDMGSASVAAARPDRDDNTPPARR